MSYGSYNILEKSYKYNTIAYTSNHKFLPLESQVYLKRNNCRQEYDHHHKIHEHTRDHNHTHNSKHEHTRYHNHPHQMCTKC